MCWYRFLYIFYKQEIKHCLLNVYVNISVLSDLKLPASLEMIVHVDWKAGLRKSHIPCGTQFKCLVGGERAARHMSLVAGRIPAGFVYLRHTISVYHTVICFCFLWYLCFEVGVYNLVVIIGC
jgi:hypothetical protein